MMGDAERPLLGGERTLRLPPSCRTIHDMLDFQCWFCGDGIDRNDDSALMVSVESLWRWLEGAREKDAPFQTIYAHSRCAKDRMAGATMQLEASVFGKED